MRGGKVHARSSEDLVIDALIIDEVVEELVHGFGRGLGDHVAGSFHGDHCEIIGVELVETSVLVSNVPGVPLAHLRPTHLLDIQFGISEGDDIIPIPTEEPDLDSSVIEDPLVFCHGAPFRDGIGDIRANLPGLVDLIDLVCHFIEVPIGDGAIVGGTIGDFPEGGVLFLRDQALGKHCLSGGECLFQPKCLRGSILAGLVDICIGGELLYWLMYAM